MIAIVSSDPQDRAALVALCDTRRWASNSFESVRSFRRSLDKMTPRVVVTRRKLTDGYSDDVLSAIRDKLRPVPDAIVLTPASTPSVDEARQIAIGADCVLRDPVRPEVLIEYLAKYHTRAAAKVRANRRAAKTVAFAGGVFDPVERTLRRARHHTQLTPREAALARTFVDRCDEIVSYEELYEVVLDRRFRGDTSNMRVLLGKLGASAARIGVTLRKWVQVIPKTGYRYTTK